MANRILVCGGRDFTDTVSAYKVLDAMHRALGIDIIIEGDARGADRIAGFWAHKNRDCGSTEGKGAGRQASPNWRREMTQELIERLEPCPFCRSQMQLGLQMFKHPAMDDGECPLQDLAFRNELASAWNTRDQSQSARIAELEGVLEQVRDWRVNGAPDKWVATREEMRILARLALTKDSTCGD